MRIFLRLVFLISPLAGFSQSIFWNDCADISLCFDQNSCSVATANLSATATTTCGGGTSNINYTYKLDLGNNGSIDQQGPGNSLNVPLPAGVHKMTWRATDGCAGVATCSQFITVADCQPPNLLCINGLTQSLDANCHLSFSAQQFVLSVSDNCTPEAQLQYGIRRAGQGTGFPPIDTIAFGICDNGTNIIEVWVRDGAGLSNLCNNYVLVQDNSNFCPCVEESNVTLQGCIRTAGNQRLQTCRLRAQTRALNAQGVAGAVLKTRTVTQTDSCFNLTVADLPVMTDIRTTLRPSRNDNPSNGFSTVDLALISKHILGAEPFVSFYQTYAADINNSQTITVFDIVEGRKVLLGIYDTFPDVPSWRFTKPVPNPALVGDWTHVKDSFVVDHIGITGDSIASGIAFVAIKTGDVNRSAFLTGGFDDRGADLPLRIEDMHLSPGKYYEIPVFPEQTARLATWQLALWLDPQGIEIIDVGGLSPDACAWFDDGRLRMVWLDENNGNFMQLEPDKPLFVMKLRAKQWGRLRQFFQVKPDQLEPESLTDAGVRRMFDLRWSAASAQIFDVRFRPPFPNPVSDRGCAIEFELPKPATVHFKVYDLSGKLVLDDSGDVDAGAQTLSFDAHIFPFPGIYYYRFETAGFSSSGFIARK